LSSAPVGGRTPGKEGEKKGIRLAKEKRDPFKKRMDEKKERREGKNLPTAKKGQLKKSLFGYRPREKY